MFQRIPARKLLRVVTLAGALAAPLRGRAELSDRILSVVGDDVITASELELELALQALDVSPIPPLQDPSRDALTRLEDYRLVKALASEIRIYQPEDREVDARLAAVRDRFPDHTEWGGFLAAYGLTEPALEGILRGRMIAEAAIYRNVGLEVISSNPDPMAQEAAYREAYDAWIAQRRAELSIRRIEPQGDAP